MAVHAFDKVNQISKAKSKQIASESSVVRPESMPSVEISSYKPT
jgi:hypothetical protein